MSGSWGNVTDAKNADLLNSGAYALTESRQQLELAENSARRAVELLTNESAQWAIDNGKPEQTKRMHLLVAAWDTLGWALMQEGKPEKIEEAYGYVRAAWRNSLRADIGLHLGEIEEKRGHKQAALATYTLAVASLPLGIPGAQALLMQPAKVELQERLGALKSSGIRVAFRDATMRLQGLRTLPIGASSNIGVTQCTVLLRAGEVVDVQPAPKGAIDQDPSVRRADFKEWFPPYSHANLVLSGMRNCHGGACEFVVLPSRF